jgi:hypothetical protein
MVRILQSAALLILVSGAVLPGSQHQPARVNPNAATLKDFTERVDQYVALHRKLESTLPALPKQTNPTEIDQHERKLAVLIQEARKDAKPGDLFTPAMQRLIRSMLRPIFAGKDGRQIKSEIVDNEYKGSVKLAVNGRYPDEVPISTVPPQVLAQLPKLPEQLEYRFIQNNMILFDPHSHTIADYVERAFQ